jgi:hypothetical protein
MLRAEMLTALVWLYWPHAASGKFADNKKTCPKTARIDKTISPKRHKIIL